MTIGQAFELAYRRFLETSGKELAVQHRIQSLQDRNSQLESENGELKRRLQDLVALAPQVRFVCLLMHIDLRALSCTRSYSLLLNCI